MDNLQLVSQTISTKYVPPPTPRECINSILSGLKIFTNQIRWIDFFTTNKNLQNEVTARGLGTDLRGPTSTAPKSRDFVETFNKVLVRNILGNFKIDWSTETFSSTVVSSNNTLVSSFMQDIRMSGDYVIVATDKTNSWRKIPTKDYENYALNAINDVAIATPREVLVETCQVALNFAENLLAANKISKKEFEFLINNIKTKSVPWFKILIKDHKAVKFDGSYETRLITPCGNFISSFNKLGSTSIKRIFDENLVTLPWLFRDSFEAKEAFDSVSVQPNSSLVLLDVVSMYPSIDFQLVKLAVNYYASDFSSEHKTILKTSLEVLEFGMSNIFCKFKDQFYRYVGSGGSCALSQGGYESAFLADLVINYVFIRSSHILTDKFYFKRCFKDDAFLVCHDLKVSEIKEKIDNFQSHVQNYAPNLKFKMDLGECEGKFVDYLDMTVCIKESTLSTSVFIKKCQTIKYLNRSSMHPTWQIRNISSGVLRRLVRLTTVNEDMLDTKVLNFYPAHKKALTLSGLPFDKNATFRSVLLDLDKSKKSKNPEPTQPPNSSSTTNSALPTKNSQPTTSPTLVKSNASTATSLKSNRRLYFCTKFIPRDYMYEPIHCIIKRLLKLFNIKIDFSMSYSRHANLGEILFGDLIGKVMVGVEDLNMSDLQCNCKGGFTKCKMPGICGKQNCIYSMTCKMCPKGSIYVGSTARSLKTRTTEHLYLLRKFLKFGSKSDSFVSHMSSHFTTIDEAPMETLRSVVDFDLVTSLRNNSRAGTDKCGLCAAERYSILVRIMRGEEIMNCRDELLFSCRHKAQFPRWNTILLDDDELIDITDDPV